jgi:hypothetical protein
MRGCAGNFPWNARRLLLESTLVESGTRPQLQDPDLVAFDTEDRTPDAETDDPATPGLSQSLDSKAPAGRDGIRLEGVERQLELVIHGSGQSVELPLCPDPVDDSRHGLAPVTSTRHFSGDELPFLPAIELLHQASRRFGDNHFLDRVVQRGRVGIEPADRLHGRTSE